MGGLVIKRYKIIQKIIFSIIFFMILGGVWGCNGKVGNAHGMKRYIPASQMFTEKEIDAAMNVVAQEFESGFANCTLTDIWYAGDESNEMLLLHENGDERRMFIYTNFNINSSTGIYATCNGWKWIVNYGCQNSRYEKDPDEWHVSKNGYGNDWLTYDKIGKILYDAYHGIADYDITFYTELD